jgi:hypothetical protein
LIQQPLTLRESVTPSGPVINAIISLPLVKTLELLKSFHAA